MIEELMEFVDVKEGKDDELVEFIRGKMLTPDSVRKFLEKAITLSPTAEERQAIQPILDKYHHKGLETWKSNHMDSIIEEEVAKRNPGETPEQKRIRALEIKLEEAEKKERKMRLETHAQNLASQNGLPTDLVSFFVGQDEVSTEGNVEKFGEVLNDYVQAQVKSRFRDGGRNIQTPRQATAGEVDKLRERYEKAGELGLKTEEKLRLKRQIQESERME